VAKKKKTKIRIPEDEEELIEDVEEGLKKGKGFVKKARSELEKDEKKLKKFIDKEVRVGRKFVRKEKVVLEEDIREHPLEYVAGALIIGFVLGKLSK